MRNLTLFAGIALLCLGGFFAIRAVLPPAPPPHTAEKTLVIYSCLPAGITDDIVREFRQRTGIRTRVISAGTVELIGRMKENAKKGEADLIWGAGAESLETVSDYFARRESGEKSAIIGTYKAAHGLWLPFSVRPTVIIYNASLVPPEHRPASWSDLLDPYFRDRLILADPEQSDAAFTVLATMLRTMSQSGGGNFSGWAYAEKLIAQIGSAGVAGKEGQVYRSVASGDFYAGITFENDVLSLQKTGTNVGYCYPVEGTTAVPDGIALLKTAQHVEEAGRFMDFVLGYDVQSILSARWQLRSVRSDVHAEEMDSIERHLVAYPSAEAASSREAILARWADRYARRRP